MGSSQNMFTIASKRDFENLFFLFKKFSKNYIIKLSRGGILKVKLYVANDGTVNFIQFKNIKIALDRDICIFISDIDKNNNIKVNRYVREKLLKKFKVYYWDYIDCNENILHIKFLVKYSPILSKFVDLTEFDTIEFTPSSDNVVDNWSSISYVNLNDGKEFFNVYDVACTEQDIISLKIDLEFLTILKKQKFH